MNVSNPSPEPRLRQLFLQALDLADPAERERFLADACGADQALHRQLEQLLAQHKDDSFLEQPPFDPPSAVTLKPAAPQAGAAPGCEPGDQPPPASTLLRYFGDYELLEEIARGGMGVVWQARQKSLNRIVAVKMILGGQLATEADVRRFHTEAEAAANLNHPNIVAIHEIGEHEGRHYFSMDYVEGKNLAQALNGEPMATHKAATMLKTLAEAVHYAHQRGTLHRDLKPQNVLIDAEGRPHITDFGLAKQMTAQSDLTQTGTVMGSPSYMPPEQALGKQGEVGPASDVYALGAVLYQLVTGKAPFLGATPVDTLRQVVEQEPVALSKLNPNVPPDLETICLKCLEKKPERRYPSARALAEELDRLLNHEPILAKPASAARKVVSWCRRHPWVITAAAAGMVLGLAGLAFGLWQQTRFLNWRHAHPDARLAPAKFKELWIVIWVATLGLFFPTAHYEELFRKRRQQPQARLRQSARRAFRLGAFATGLSVGVSLEVIRQLVWSHWSWHDVLAVTSIVFVLCWNGLILVWKSLRQSEAIVLAADYPEDGAFKLEMNPAAFLFAFPIANWLAMPIGRSLVAWNQYQAPQGFLADGTYVFTPAMTAAYQTSLAGLFSVIACSLAMVLPLGVAAWRSPRGNALRAVAPLAIGFLISFVALMSSFIPPSLTAAALLLGFILGLALVAAVRVRTLPVGEDAGKDWKLRVNEKAILRLLPWAVLGLAANALMVASQGWMQTMQTFAFGILFSAIGVLAAGWRQPLARHRGLFAGSLFFTFFLAMNGTLGLPDPHALWAALWRLGPAIIVGGVLYRAARRSPARILAGSERAKP